MTWHSTPVTWDGGGGGVNGVEVTAQNDRGDEHPPPLVLTIFQGHPIQPWPRFRQKNSDSYCILSASVDNFNPSLLSSMVYMSILPKSARNPAIYSAACHLPLPNLRCLSKTDGIEIHRSIAIWRACITERCMYPNGQCTFLTVVP